MKGPGDGEMKGFFFQTDTVDGSFRHPAVANAPVEGQVVYPVIYKVLAPSQVVFSPDS